MAEIWQEPVRGSLADPASFRLDGLTALRHYLSGEGGSPPTYHLTGLELTGADEGTAVFELPVTDWLLGPKGTVHAGMLAFLADGALGCAIQTVLPAEVGYTTAELSMTFLEPATREEEVLTATAKLVHARESVGLAEVFVRGQSGHLLAHGTSRCFVFPLPDEIVLPELPGDTGDGTPDPYLRRAEGMTLDPGVVSQHSGLELLRAQVHGDVALPPVHHLTGIRPVEADESRVVFTMPASPWLLNPAGMLYGGAIAFLAKSAAAGAVQTIAPAGTTYTALDVKVNFLRPVFADGRDLVATGTVVHPGRSLAVSTGEVVDSDGEQVALATGSTALARSR